MAPQFMVEGDDNRWPDTKIEGDDNRRLDTTGGQSLLVSAQRLGGDNGLPTSLRGGPHSEGTP